MDISLCNGRLTNPKRIDNISGRIIKERSVRQPAVAKNEQQQMIDRECKSRPAVNMKIQTRIERKQRRRKWMGVRAVLRITYRAVMSIREPRIPNAPIRAAARLGLEGRVDDDIGLPCGLCMLQISLVVREGWRDPNRVKAIRLSANGPAFSSAKANFNILKSMKT